MRKCYYSSMSLRNYITQDIFLTLIYKDVRIREKYGRIKNKNFLYDVRQIAYK